MTPATQQVCQPGRRTFSDAGGKSEPVTSYQRQRVLRDQMGLGALVFQLLCIVLVAAGVFGVIVWLYKRCSGE